MKAKAQQQDPIPPRGKILKAAATGKDRDDALRSIDELSRRASARAKTLGLTEADIQKMINEP
jgi:hypothetical protein